MHVEESDLVLRPDLSTVTILPWRPTEGRVMQFFCDVEMPDGAAFGLSLIHISYTCWPKYSAATSSMVTGMPPEKPASEDNMMSMNTMPDAPNSPVWGNRIHCSTPVTSAVNKMPLSLSLIHI